MLGWIWLFAFAIDASPTWVVARLHVPLASLESPNAVPTGSPALDDWIAAHGVSRISFAYPSTSARGVVSVPGVDRTYRFHLAQGSDVRTAARALSRVPGVVWAESDPTFRAAGVPDDPNFPAQTELARIDAVGAWDLWDLRPPSGWNATIVAVLDTGVEMTCQDTQPGCSDAVVVTGTHEDLAGKVLSGCDLVDFDNCPDDEASGGGHGTAVASMVAAVRDNGVGMAGICDDCRILPVRVLDESGAAPCTRIADGMLWAAAAGADVLVLSLQGAEGCSALQDAARAVQAMGVLAVSVSGDDDASRIEFPARYAEVLAVGATNSVDDGRWTTPCGAGAGSNHGLELDLVAPGASNHGAANTGDYADSFCGTSFGAGVAAGVIGGMRAIHPGLGTEEARHLLQSAAEDGVGSAEDTPGFDVYYGWGRLDARKAWLATLSTVLRGGPTKQRFFVPSGQTAGFSHDIVRGNLAALDRTEHEIKLGSIAVLSDSTCSTASCLSDCNGQSCIEVHDAATPAPGSGFFYLSRSNSAIGPGSFGGPFSGRHRDRGGGAGANDLCHQDTLGHPPPNYDTLPPPAQAGFRRDDTFCGLVQRMTDATVNDLDASGSGCFLYGTDYATQNKLNAARSRILVECVATGATVSGTRILDRQGSETFELTGIRDDDDAAWDPVDPDVLYYIPNTAAQIRRITLDQPAPGSYQDVLVASFAGEYATMSGKGESDIAYAPASDRRRIFAVGQTCAGCTDHEAFVYDVAAGTKIWEVPLAGQTLDSGWLSPSGDFVVLVFLSFNGSPATRVHDLTSGAFLWQVGYVSHGDTGIDATGGEAVYLLNGTAPQTLCAKNQLVRFDLAAGPGSERCLLLIEPAAGARLAAHVAAPLAPSAWVYVSTYDVAGGIVWNRFANELLRVRNDGTGGVQRLAQHHSRFMNYSSQPRASVSADGTLVLFNSNWGLQGKAPALLHGLPVEYHDVYLLYVP